MIKILIADDEGYEREILAEIIDKRFGRGAEVRMVENGRLAVDAAALWADVALLDIEMPGLSGIDAAKQILAQRPECKIIFVTAYSLFTYAHEAVKLGACDYILKPVAPDDVERAVRRAADQADATRQLEAMASSEEQLERADSYDKTNLLMGKVKKYLQHNYMMYDISLDSVSAILGLNASYFSSLFKRTFQVNFLDYLTELRMEAAKERLRDPIRGPDGPPADPPLRRQPAQGLPHHKGGGVFRPAGGGAHPGKDMRPALLQRGAGKQGPGV